MGRVKGSWEGAPPRFPSFALAPTVRVTIACENIRFSSLFAAGDVSRGGTRETFPSAKREEKQMFSQAIVTLTVGARAKEGKRGGPR